MKPVIALIWGMVMISSTVPVRAAQDGAEGAEPWEIIHVARDMGQADVQNDNMGDPMIVGEMGGQSYEMRFYGCDLGHACKAALFRARFPGPVSEDEMAQWNQQALFGRGVRDEDGMPVVEMPVQLAPSLPKPTLEAVFARWQKVLVTFADFLD